MAEGLQVPPVSLLWDAVLNAWGIPRYWSVIYSERGSWKTLLVTSRGNPTRSLV